MPGQRNVQSVKDVVTGIECLCSAAFLTGTAKEDYGAMAGTDVLQIFFDRISRCHRTGAQHMVSTAVTGTVFDQFFPGGGACDLGQAGQCVIFGKDTDDRVTGAVGCLKTGLDARDGGFNGKALFPQQLYIQLAGFVFHQRQFSKFPDVVGNV